MPSSSWRPTAPSSSAASRRAARSSTLTSTAEPTSTASHSPLEELLAFLRHSGASRAFCFCLDEPDRHPAFRAANDRTLEAAARSDGLLIPFVRLDLAEGPVEEAVRCLDRGARGIKLHPRAQAFLLNDDRLDGVFALAAERRVPILIHGGRGLPPIADDLLRLVERHPEFAAHHRPRRDRRSRRARRRLRRSTRASSSTRRSGARSTSSTSTAASRRSSCCTRPTTRTAASLQSLLLDLRIAALAGLQPRTSSRASSAATRPDRRRRSRATAVAPETRIEGVPPADPDGAHPHLSDHGDAAPVDAPAGRDRRRSASRSTPPPSATARQRCASRSPSCSPVPAISGSASSEIDDEARARAAHAPRVPASSTSQTSRRSRPSRDRGGRARGRRGNAIRRGRSRSFCCPYVLRRVTEAGIETSVVVLGAHEFPVEGARRRHCDRLGRRARRIAACGPRLRSRRSRGRGRLPRGRPADLAGGDPAGRRGMADRGPRRRRRELRRRPGPSRVHRPSRLVAIPGRRRPCARGRARPLRRSREPAGRRHARRPAADRVAARRVTGLRRAQASGVRSDSSRSFSSSRHRLVAASS